MCYFPYLLWKKVEGGRVRGITFGMSEFAQADDRSIHVVDRFLENFVQNEFLACLIVGCVKA